MCSPRSASPRAAEVVVPRPARAPAPRPGVGRHRRRATARPVPRRTRASGLVADVFADDRPRAACRATLAIGHNRYSTAGSVDAREHAAAARGLPRRPAGARAQRQPGQRARAAAAARGVGLDLPDHARHRDLPAPDGALRGRRRPRTRWSTRSRQVRGAYSLVVLTRDARARACATRTASGRCARAARATATWWRARRCALDLIAAEFVRDVEPGEMVRHRSARHALAPRARARQSAAPVHLRAHLLLAARQPRVRRARWTACGGGSGTASRAEHPAEADVVIAVPDSSNSIALGYSEALGHPLRARADPQPLRRAHVHPAPAERAATRACASSSTRCARS